MKKKVYIFAIAAVLLIFLLAAGYAIGRGLFGWFSEEEFSAEEFYKDGLSEEDELLLRQAVYDYYDASPDVNFDKIKIRRYYGEYKGIKAFSYSCM